ncbi:MAG: peptidoglycan-binding protein [Goleter apudmare HA4340-LM2]|jgi:peptidoglycan hydrolase-like protein with peptidoglycan-binding domain|nr:peptidoglycan-binding protein [Goleter apudmare HA4340-LM2]
MEAIGYPHLVSVSEASKSLEVAPVRMNFNFLNWTKLSTIAVIRLLSVSLTVGILSIAGQALAVQKVGSSGAEVTTIQRCLSKLGYFRGPVTGNFASLTQQAVISFQQANQLPADGVVGNVTQQRLQQACQSRTPSGNLQLGSRGPAVSRLQERLKQLGYFEGPITGYYGPKTQQAVIRSQQSSRVRNSAIAPTTIRQANFRTSQGGEYPVLSEGNTGEAVTRLQQRLKQLGYFPANPTGNYGPITRDAVIAFQRNSGIPVNGIANQQTWNALLGYSQNQVVARPSLSTEQVRELQERLRALGYLRANSTGYFGPLTKDALIRFQRDYRLSANGIADAQALAAVQQVSQNQYANQPAANYFATNIPPANQAARNYLTVGDSGENVKAVQERLLQIGFFNTNPDGYFGESTKSYVYAFQQYARLNPTGNVDPQTWQALGLNTSPISNSANTNRYVVIVPIHNPDTLNKVRQYLPNSVVEKSGLGDYVKAGAFGDRSLAENFSKQLRSYGFDARVEYF